jgi:dTDP-4-amino-4,6-dideoxygalactose transaminase
MSDDRIYLSPPHLGDAERQLLLDAFDSNWVSTVGAQVEAFERDVIELLSCGHAVALSSGTAALHLALVVLGVGRGDEVLCSDLTFAAPANAIAYQGATPVFIDSDPVTWKMDAHLVAEELDERQRQGRPPAAIIAVDLHGGCADYDRILDVAGRHGVPVIEDAAQALGAEYRGRPAGTLGAMGVFSFNGNKIITSGCGGMLVSRKAGWIDRARFLANQAREPQAHYEHSAIGYNYRLSNLLAAIGRAQLQRLAERVERRRSINAFYRAALADLDGLELMTEASHERSNCWLTCVTVDPVRFGASSEDIRLHLASRAIEARTVSKPMHMQPAFRGARTRGGAVAAGLFERGLCLPSGSSLSSADLERIVETLRSTPRTARPGS